MATAPTSIQVLVLPADGSELEVKTFGTVREEVKPPYYPEEFYDDTPESRESINKGGHLWAMNAAMLHMVVKGCHPAQPDISLLPKIGEDHWPAAAWEKRGVVGYPSWHMFFTMHTQDDLKTNPYVGHQVSGDVFVLWISDTEDADGRRFYVDLEPEFWDDQGSLRSLFLEIAPCLASIKRRIDNAK